MSRRWLLACSTVALGAVLVPVAGGRSSATKVSGTLTLSAFDPNKSCKFSQGTLKVAEAPLKAGEKVVLAQCSDTGKFAGTLKVKTAAYGWNWYLQLDKAGTTTTGVAAEAGAMSMTTTSGRQLLLLMLGIQKPIGAQTKTHAKGMSSGTWSVRGGKGSGTYTYQTERKGSIFTTAVLTIKGSIG